MTENQEITKSREIPTTKKEAYGDSRSQNSNSVSPTETQNSNIVFSEEGMSYYVI